MKGKRYTNKDKIRMLKDIRLGIEILQQVLE